MTIDLTAAIEAAAPHLWAYAFASCEQASLEPYADATTDEQDICRAGVRTVLDAAAPIIAAAKAEQIAQEIRAFAPQALADGDTPDAVLGLLTAAVIADGTRLTREQLTGQLDALLMRDASATAETS
jgi:hypothetical protein